jgi:hypothetical protein
MTQVAPGTPDNFFTRNQLLEKLPLQVIEITGEITQSVYTYAVIFKFLEIKKCKRVFKMAAIYN